MSDMTELTTEQQILADVRNYLDITWADPDGDKKLSGFIARGMAFLDDISGDAQDYMAESSARQLLFDYVRYARSNALHEFRTNHLPDLLALQLARGVERFG